MTTSSRTRIRALRAEQLEPRVVLDAALGEVTDLLLPAQERVIVVLNKNAGRPDVVAQELSAQHGGDVRHVYDNALHGFSGQFPLQALQGLRNHPWVDYVQPVTALQATAQTIPTGVGRIGLEEYFPELTDSRQKSFADLVNVAVIDTGIDHDHPDLNVRGGANFVATASSWYDDHGHGTHVAGTIGALDNAEGVVGVAPGANLYGLKVLDSSGYGATDDIIAAIDWVTKTRTDGVAGNDIHVANMSLGGTGRDTALHTAIQNSVNAGVVFVVAAGNDTRDVYGTDGVFDTSDDYIPAAYPEAMTISAFTDYDGQSGGTGGSFWDVIFYGADDSFGYYSNYSNSVAAGNPVSSPGNAIDLVLPGTNIYSTDINGYSTKTGTSMAAPHGAGLAAIYIAQNGYASGASGVYAVRQALINGGKPQTSQYGLVNGGDPDNGAEPVGWPVVADVVAPAISITQPTDGQTVSGSSVPIQATVSGEGVTQVEFLVDSTRIAIDSDGSDGWSTTWDTTTSSNGAHQITAATHGTIIQATSSITVTVDNPVAAATVHVGDLDATKNVKGKSGKWEAFFTIEVHNNSDQPVAGAEVKGAWVGSNGSGGSLTGTTDSSGRVTVSTGNITADSVTYTVDSITAAGYTYYNSDNHDPDSGAVGPSASKITIYRASSGIQGNHRLLAGGTLAGDETAAKRESIRRHDPELALDSSDAAPRLPAATLPAALPAAGVDSVLEDSVDDAEQPLVQRGLHDLLSEEILEALVGG